MKKPRTIFLRFAIPVIRIIIGMAFFLSGIFKIIDISSFQKAIDALGLLGGPLPFLASMIIPVLEIILGLLLVLGIYIRITALHLDILVIIFAWVTFYVLRSRPDMLCGCFGGFIDMTFSVYHLIVLFVIFILNLVLVVEPADTWSLQKLFRERVSAARKVLIMEIATYVLIGIGILLIGFAVYMNFREPARQADGQGSGKPEAAIEEEEPEEQAPGSLEGPEDIAVEDETGDGDDSSGEPDGQEAGQGEIEDITVDQAYEAYQGSEGFIFVDVRSASEFESGHIKGAVHIPVQELEDRAGELPQDSPIVVYCNGSSCNRSGVAARILVANGFQEVYDLTGKGIDEWISKGYPSQ